MDFERIISLTKADSSSVIERLLFASSEENVRFSCSGMVLIWVEGTNLLDFGQKKVTKPLLSL